MNRLVRICLLFCLVLVCSLSARASHIYGADLVYTHLTGNQYKVTLTLYGDCSADYSLFNQLYVAKPRIVVYRGGAFYSDTMAMRLEAGSGIEVSPVCAAQINQTHCNAGTLPGVKQFIYSGTISLPAAGGWRFVFTGGLGGDMSGLVYSAGRSNSITNAEQGTQMRIEAYLDNTLGANSSPVYHTIPTPFYCINVPQQYNHGAVDPEVDSLAFILVPGADAVTGGTVSYIYPYTAQYPLATSAGGFSFNPFNGQMAFIPNLVQDALVVNQINEYRNGRLVGTSQREMTFIVQSNCSGTPPVASVNSLVGAVLTEGNVINICVGQPSVSFNVSLYNPGGDVTDITKINVPPGAILNILNNNTPSPSATFNWNTSALGPGHYTFFLVIKNDHCPLINTQTVAYTINVAAEPQIKATQKTPTNCIYPARMEYELRYGFAPRTIVVMQGTSVVKTIIDNSIADSTVIIDSLPPGNYTAVVKSDLLCVDSAFFTIVDSGSLAIPPVDLSICRGDPSLPLYIPPIVSGASVAWFATDSTPLVSPPVVNTSSEGVYEWYFIESYSVCNSGPVPVTATVHQLPHAQILNIPAEVCYGDDIYLQASGGVAYAWQPESAIKYDTGYYVQVLLPITLVVTVKDQYGCIDTTSVTYDDIQQCCRFSYPNAFTPNNDGNNDGFRVVTYGNMLHYALTIFNRWGQPVFFTADPQKPWDGTYGGQPCEIGTYYYYMNAECMTGPKQTYKGDVILIR